nr:immunoglobulin heavy chain junction region [Macaca mulatta]MOW99067.1 immunoglobulin heavy chain junction region [Macaca mulatta]MOX02572.1 immunoglobulin heavy chain junction region [Macaca mulatta]MOX02623.1 immunoglobulin heavy chain junction region [Macaca mulatta]
CGRGGSGYFKYFEFW